MPLPNQLLESLGRRNSLKGLLGIGISAISGMTQARMNQVLGTQNISNGKLSLMSQERLLDLVDEAESLLRKKMPEGTKNEDIRFFAIVPDRENIMKKDIVVYNGKLVPQYDKSGRQKGKKIQIIDGNGLAQFPNAEIIKGRGVGARIKLNDPNYIILSIGSPVRTESLPEDEKSLESYTMVASTPPNKALQTPAMLAEGRMYLRETINEVFVGALQEEDLESSILPDKSVHTAVDRRLVILFAIVEHMDIGSLGDASDEKKLEEEYARVLTNYGLNRNLAYRYGKSSAGARGMMQITSDTYTRISGLYEDTNIGDDHIEASTDPEKSIMITAIKIDDDLFTLQKNTNLTKEQYQSWKDNNSKDRDIPLALGVLYNAGTRFLRQMRELGKIGGINLPEETKIYLKKIEYVWGRLHEGRISLSSPTIIRKTEKAKGAPQARKKYTEKQVRDTLRGRRFRLNFEKNQAKVIAPRALTFTGTAEFIRTGRLLKIRNSSYYVTNDSIGAEGKASEREKEMLYYLTPVAKHNLGKISEKYVGITGTPMNVTSMNRNAEYVKKLRKVNPRATSPSSHEYGTTFDCRKIRDKRQASLFEEYLLDLQKKGYIIVIKESACYHIFSELKI